MGGGNRTAISIPGVIELQSETISGPWCSAGVEDIDLRVTRQEGPGYSYGRCQKPGAKLEDDGPEMG